ncbi:MAG: hypothetical protein CR997_10575 [Acidobacteria bacterium]|nr:MAG: hypothetical protein CR997_10575 [Acidobacteriota bacterium]
MIGCYSSIWLEMYDDPGEKKTVKKYIVDGLLIVFSVLFALAINKIAENYQTKKKKSIALACIQKELQRSSDTLQAWRSKHAEAEKVLTSLIEGKNDGLKSRLIKDHYLDFSLLTNGSSLADNMMTSTAWETAKSTGIIAEFDFETTQKLTDAYLLQKLIIDETMVKILNYYLNPESHKRGNIDITLVQLRFRELIGQEKSMEYLYESALTRMK